MNAYEHQLLQATWATLEASPNETTATFFERLFVLDPSLRLLFLDGDLAVRGRVLLQAIGVAVANADRLQQLVTESRDDGIIRASAVRLGGDDVAAQALLAAAERVLGGAWTPPVAHVWTAFCALLCASQRRAVRLPVAA